MLAPAFRKLGKNEKRNARLLRNLDEVLEKKKIAVSAKIQIELAPIYLPYRLFDRSRLYIDFQYKLMQNMLLAAQAVKQEVRSILIHYKDVKAYHDALGRKEVMQLKMMSKKT